MAAYVHNSKIFEQVSVDDLIGKINTYNLILPRKTPDSPIFSIDTFAKTHGKYAETVKSNIKYRAKESLDNKKGEMLGENNDKWDGYHALELALVMEAKRLGFSYGTFLAGRELMYHHGVIRGIKSVMPDLKGKKAFEIGGGTGLGLIGISKLGVEVTNYDFSEIALQFFNYLANHYGVQKMVNTVRGNFYEIQLPNKKSDGISDITLSIGVAEHLEKDDLDRHISEMVRITAPNGIVFLAVPNLKGPHYQRMRSKRDKFFEFWGIENPMAKTYEVDVKKVLERHGLVDIVDDGMHLAPSSQVEKSFFRDFEPEDLELFSYLHETGADISNKISLWILIEDKATPVQRKRIGWFHYGIGRKPA